MIHVELPDHVSLNRFDSKKVAMPDWLRDVASAGTELTLAVIASRLVIAALMGLVVACVYQGSSRRQIGESYPFIVTLTLLTILVAMTTLVIGDQVARAFSLVGALSIVRFRTVVDDTRDTAFVIFAVIVGMAVGAGMVTVYLLGIPVVALVSGGFSLMGRSLAGPGLDRRLEIRVEGGLDSDALLSQVFRDFVLQNRLTAVSTAKQGAAIDLVYVVRLNRSESSLQFVRALAQLDGVQNVELK